MLKAYYRLTKPGIIYGNIFTSIAGFLLASGRHINIGLMLATLLGIALVIACGCVYNNYIDRGIDVKMARTKKRALVKGTISNRSALIYGTVLGVLGFIVLASFTNSLTVILGIAALTVYVILYGVAKRRSVHGTLIGSIAGALPPLAGYTAVSNHIDAAAVLVFLIVTLWQMPHFYSIAIFRFDDYKAAGLPVLPVEKGIRVAKIQILLYVVAFVVATSLLTILGYTGYIYLAVASILGCKWLWLAIQGFKANDDKKWARKMFFTSLLVISILSVTISVDAWLI
ncbi:MAG TPA: heme o synthase [Patescibacteria group bacterium]|nr:heme o synthase [Patescibacteria group bacterium]